eukprot:TRINITY_DN4106_c0_g1_i1.p1 TRINITY_DN4106_c0_g1~~TRINITY_DN4106_c0_g1_i1.p1  ORF type:complete len:133 (+),score=9.88 TRINITY_DN4106_c0_g1_i1:214-612(+)
MYEGNGFSSNYVTWNTADVRKAVHAATWEHGNVFPILTLIILCILFVLCLDLFSLVFIFSEKCFPTSSNVHRFERMPAQGNEMAGEPQWYGQELEETQAPIADLQGGHVSSGNGQQQTTPHTPPAPPSIYSA